MNVIRLLLLIVPVLISFTYAKKTKYDFKTIKDDIYKTHYFELENGLKIYLVQHKKTPTVYVEAIFNVGSKNDPKNSTGLAHYLEHLMSHGTSKIGSLDYEKEKPLLDKIETLFEKLKVEKDLNKRKSIYKEIDDYSFKASKLSTSDEYTSILKSLGGSYINAATDQDNTVFYYTIPKNNLEKSLKVLSEQLFNFVVRRFSTELQAVYEEYVRNNENSNNICYEEIMKEICKDHPYSIPIIGKPEHLRSPSIKDVKEFYNKYYHPNNCTLLLVGDIEYNHAIDIIEKKFGKLKKKEIEKSNFKDIILPEKNSEINIISEDYNYGGFIFPYKTNDIQYNYKIQILCGLLHRYLQKLATQQKVYNITVYNNLIKDIGSIILRVIPLDRQSLKDAKKIVFEELKKFCKGIDNIHNFNSIKNETIYNLRNDDERYNIISNIRNLIHYNSFIDIAKSSILSNELINKLKKEDCENILKDLISKPYISVNKNSGNRNFDKIEKLQCPNMFLNSDKKSDYFKNLDKIKTNPIEPITIDYNKDIKKYKYNDNVEFYYVKKNDKKLFEFSIRFEYGELLNRDLQTLSIFLKNSKSRNYTYDKFIENILELGSRIYFDVDNKYCTLNVKGISENFDKTIKLVSDYISNISFDNECINKSIKNYINENYKFRYKKILLKDYKNFIIDNTEIKKFNTERVKNMFNLIMSAQAKVLFSSDLEPKQFIDKLISTKLLDKCNKKYNFCKYESKKYNKNKIYIVNSHGSQNISCTIFSFLNKIKPEDFYLAEIYSEYYSNIYFKELREKNGLTYGQYWYAFKINDNDKDLLKIGFDCQPNKFVKAFSETFKLFNFNKNKDMYDLCYKNLRDRVNCLRFNDMSFLNTYFYNKEIGIDTTKTNSLELALNTLNNLSIDTLLKFHNDNVRDNIKVILIVGNMEDINVNFLSKYGEVKELK